MDELNNPNYCPLFFKGMYAWVDGQQSHVGHCCVSGISENISRPDFFHPYLENTRTTWNSGPRKDCKQCWDVESRGFTSNRQHYISWVKNLGIDPSTPELLRLDFSVGSGCNAKCITCNAGSSTTWAAEDSKFGVNKFHHNIKTTVKEINQIQNIDVSKLREVYFTGGEPLMSRRPVELLKHVKDNGTISGLEFSCNTNGSIMPSDELMSLWDECKSVNIYFSIDGIGREFEYIRCPLKWQQVESNIRLIQSLKINVNISVTVGIHNIDSMPDLYSWFKSLSLPKRNFLINRCWGDLDFSAASESLKAYWRQELASIDQPWAEVVQSMILEPGRANDSKWESWLKEIDRRRNANWQDELPKLAIAKNKAVCYTL